MPPEVIILSFRITEFSSTLIDNIFINFHEHQVTSGNITSLISDHLPQFILIRHGTSTNNDHSNVFERNWKQFDKEDFILDFLDIDWNATLDIEKQDIDISFELFLANLDKLLDKHAPLQKVTKRQFKTRSKPWITGGILRSISIRDRLYKSYVTTSDPEMKSTIFSRFKTLQELDSHIM